MEALKIQAEAALPATDQQPEHACLELLKRNGKIALRMPIPATGLTLGRALDNDLIIDDPFACPHHCRIFWQAGKLCVEDLGSLNGTWIDGELYRQKCGAISSRSSILIGRTSLRQRLASDRLPETWTDHSLHSPLRHLERPVFPLLIFVITLGYALLDSYLDSVKPLESKILLPVIVYILALVGGWAALWSFSNRIVTQRWNVLIHAAIGCLFLLGLDFWEFLVEYGCFAFALDRLVSPLQYAGSFLLVSGLFYLHLGVISPKPRWRLLRTSLISATVLLGLTIGLVELKATGFQADPDYQVVLKSPAFRVRAAASSTDFFTQAEQQLEPLKGQTKQP